MKSAGIDEEKPFQMITSEAREREGYGAMAESTGRAGVDRWRTDPTDVVMLDCALRDIDGLEALREIRVESNSDEVEEAACVGCLLKPVRPVELTRAITSASAGSEPRAGADPKSPQKRVD